MAPSLSPISGQVQLQFVAELRQANWTSRRSNWPPGSSGTVRSCAAPSLADLTIWAKVEPRAKVKVKAKAKVHLHWIESALNLNYEPAKGSPKLAIGRHKLRQNCTPFQCKGSTAQRGQLLARAQQWRKVDGNMTKSVAQLRQISII